MKQKVVNLVERITFRRVRGQALAHGAPSLRWWWTPWTYRFRHGGWVYLSPQWLRRFWRGA